MKTSTRVRGGLFGAALALAVMAMACTPAQQAVEQKVEQTVLDDLAKGKTLAQIEVDVAVDVVGQPGADVVVIVNDALAFLIDVGIIPANLIPKASLMRAEGSAKLAARGAK